MDLDSDEGASVISRVVGLPSADTQRKTGALLTGVGALLFLLGVLLFFDRGLIAMSNVVFVLGVALVVGLRRCGNFFFQRRRLRGTLCLALGLALVLLRRTVLGILVEAFGFVNLFGDFFPLLFAAARRLPIVGPLLQAPGIKQAIDRLITGDCLPL